MKSIVYSTLIGLIVLSLLTVPIACVYRLLPFEQGCRGHVDNAVKANSTALAVEELTIAISYAENHGLTSGNTSLIWETPDNDIRFWYLNLKALRTSLQQNDDGVQQNILTKLSTSLKEIKYPEDIELYPNRGIWFVLGFLWVPLIIVLVGIAIWFDRRKS